ncbi:hypothetical protein DCC35_13005 [Mangrovivirga cuniculi]|uniref:Uncharacterized protein n=1 Tax=Mangrovivirga cuniculi TaxID=2715131 RepID=A0A4D7K8J7_9BACT|nr:hypothetical protein DCC35_13005 [Mangrovivirga cuniculi]
MEAHHYGYLIAGASFGIQCQLLGIHIYKINVFPKVLGGLLLDAAAGYLGILLSRVMKVTLPLSLVLLQHLVKSD